MARRGGLPADVRGRRRCSSTRTSRACRCGRCCCAGRRCRTPALIDRYVARRADAILVGHTHWDHAVDAPAIARRDGATVYGSRLARAADARCTGSTSVVVEPQRRVRDRPVRGALHAQPALEAAVRPQGPVRRPADVRGPARRSAPAPTSAATCSGSGSRSPGRASTTRAAPTCATTSASSPSTSSSPASPGARSRRTTGAGSCRGSTRGWSSRPTTTTSSRRSDRPLTLVRRVDLDRAAGRDPRGVARATTLAAVPTRSRAASGHSGKLEARSPRRAARPGTTRRDLSTSSVSVRIANAPSLEHPLRRRQPERDALGLAQRGHEVAVGQRVRGGEVDRAVEVLALDQEPDRARRSRRRGSRRRTGARCRRARRGRAGRACAACRRRRRGPGSSPSPSAAGRSAPARRGGLLPAARDVDTRSATCPAGPARRRRARRPRRWAGRRCRRRSSPCSTAARRAAGRRPLDRLAQHARSTPGASP